MSAIYNNDGRTDHAAYGQLDDNNPTFYDTFSTVVARDKRPEGDRFALATWAEDMSSYTHEDFIPQNYGASDAPVLTPQDAGLIGRSMVNPRY